jgi:hypothetical protein
LSGGAKVLQERGALVIRSAGPLATIDVKDADVHDILRSLAGQCGIRNLIVDRAVSGKGTFLLRDVPCRRALEVVLGTMDLKADWEPNSVVVVSPRR